MSHILVTGGTGFLGSKLVKELSRENYVVNLSRNRNDDADENIIQDIRDPISVSGFDIIYHMAAVSSPRICETESEKALEVNTESTLRICNQMEEDQKIIFPSSVHVYGNEKAKKTETERLKPKNFYGLTKKFSEEIIENKSRTRDFDYTILRLFNIYGPEQPRGRIISDVIHKCRNQEKVEVIDGRKELDLVYIDNAVDILSNRKLEGVYNVCTGKGTEINSIYEIIGNYFSVEIISDEEGEKEKLVGNNEKIKSNTSRDFIHFEEGIDKVIK